MPNYYLRPMQKFVVSARKYRPQRFDEVVGQAHVGQTLKNAMANNHLAHAFLFCGPRGVGKTTCARILAKTLNCERVSDDFEPCNTCNSCTSFNDNASFNITELDAASNNSVEHIRALIEQVRFAPQQGDYKVFIIDEVHMLSSQAFNAFLKTLEEPPSYAKFILATTEKHKILPTILSRCQIFDFRRIQVNDIVSHLEGICAKENIEAEKDALHIIAQKADGALRDALSIFDRMVSFGGNKITYAAVIENLNLLDYEYFFKIVQSLQIEDLPAVLATFNEILHNGFDPDIFINGLAEHLRNLLVCKNEKTLHLLELSENLKVRYKEQANSTGQTFLLTALNVCNDCDVNYKMARNKRLHVEMALVKMAYIHRASKVMPLTPEIAEKKTPELSEATRSVKNSAPPKAKAVAAKVEKSAEPINVLSKSSVESISEAEQQEPPMPVEPPMHQELSSAAEPMVQYEPQEVVKAPAEIENIEIPDASNDNSSSSLLLSRLEEEMFGETIVTADESMPALEVIEEAWAEESMKVASPTFKNIVKHARLSTNEHTLTVKVGSKMARDLVINEVNFSRSLKTRIKFQKLIIQVEVDPEMVTAQKNTKPRKVLTIKETYELMKTTNPSVEELRTRFDLKIDQ